MVFKLILQPCRVHACEENGILQHPPHRSKRFVQHKVRQFIKRNKIHGANEFDVP